MEAEEHTYYINSYLKVRRNYNLLIKHLQFKLKLKFNQLQKLNIQICFIKSLN